MILGGNSIDEPKDLVVNDAKNVLFYGARTFSTDGDIPGNAGGSDFWVMKRNIDGSPIWSKNFGGPSNDDLAAVMAHSDGGVLAFGTTRTSQGPFGTITGLAGGWLMRTNSNGTIIDGKIFGGNITETAVDAFRHVTGNVTMALEAGSAMLNGQTNNGILDVWIVHVNPSLNIQWTALLGGTDTDVPEAITADINGNVYIAATSESNLPGLDTNKGEKDVWIIKLDPNGEMLWQKSFGGSDDDEATDILFHPDGYVFVLTQSRSSDGDFDSNDGINDVWLIKLDETNGQTLGLTSYGGSGNDFNGHLDVFGDDHLVITMSTTSDDLDITGNKGFGDVWILNTDLNGTITQQMNYGGTLNDLAVDIVSVDSVFHVLSSSLSIDKNVPNNSLAQQDLWYYTLNTRPDTCSPYFICLQDSSSTNHIFPPSTDVLICVNGCTAGYGSGPDFNIGNCPDFPNSTAYFYLTTDANVDLLTISVTSNEFNQPQIALLKTVNCISYQQVECATGTNGSVIIPYIDIQPLTTYVVAISDVEGNIGEFEFCATAIDVEFCNEEDRIFVTNTSMGSPLNGPYKPGEEVQICYELENWKKLDCNGFQGLVPTFGPGWDTTWFDLFGQPVQVDSMIVPVEEGFWAWYKVGDVRYNVSNPINGYDGGQGMPAGWYFTNTGDPPPATNPDQTTGDINSCLPTSDKWKVCFTLKVVDECESNLDCSISMKTFADGEVGINSSLACAYDQEEVFTAFMQCCLNPTVLPIQDFTICSGDTISFQPETNLLPPVTYTWIVDPNPFITGTSPGTNASRFFQVLETEAAIPLGVSYSLRASGNGCFTDPEDFEVTVLPLPTSQISISGPNIVCSGSTVTLNFTNTGTPPFAIGLFKDNEFFANVLSESSFLSIDIDPEFSGRFKVGTLSDASCEGQGFGFVNVTVKPINTEVIDTAICEGGSVVVGTEVYDEAGTYTITLEEGGENNCDSVVILTLSINPTLEEFVDEVICNGDTLFVLGQPYTETTNETIEYAGPGGCPAFVHLNLLVKDTFSMEINQTICNGDTLEFEGIQVYEEGSYSHVEQIRPGCFEETVLNLDVLPAITINDLAIIGDNGFNNGAILVEIVGGSPPFTYLWNTNQTTESLFNIAFGDYSLTVTDRLGCDQTFTFEVPFINATNETDQDHAVIKAWPTLTTSGGQIQLLNAGSVAVTNLTAFWWTLDGRKRKALDKITIEAASTTYLKVPELFTTGIYYLQLSSEGISYWVKIAIQ
jgi:Beta-propeller repeat/PKD-like domain